MTSQGTQLRDGLLRFKAGVTEPLWTVRDVAAYLRLKHETVRMMARAKRIPAVKVGKVWRFRASEIKDMVSSKPSLVD